MRKKTSRNPNPVSEQEISIQTQFMMLLSEKGDDVFLPYLDDQSKCKLAQSKYFALTFKQTKV